MTILWLVSWYPNRLSPFDGDFIRRQAEAAALYADIHVIFVVKDEEGKVTKTVAVEECSQGRLRETIIYYHVAPRHIFSSLVSAMRYRKLYLQAVTKHIEAFGKPVLLHAHVAMKAGWIAALASKKWKIPFILTEHWTGYLKEADDRLDNRPALFRRLTAKVLAQAEEILVVSDYLGKAMQAHFPRLEYSVVPNVVNTAIFFPGKQLPQHPHRFIHISNMNYQKNADNMLKAFASLAGKGYDFRLELYGTAGPGLQALAKSLALENRVFFRGEVSQPELADAIRASHALILYSRYETFGCVLIEANACAVPVIVSDIPVFHERVREGENGLFALPNSVDDIAGKIAAFMDGQYRFDPLTIAATAEKYSYEAVGRMLADCYALY